MALVDLISVTSIIDISQVPFAGDIKIKECLIMIRKKINSTLEAFLKYWNVMRCIRNSKKTLYFLGKSHALIIPHSIHSFVVIVFRHIPKNDIPLFEKVQQTHFLVWDTPDHTNIHMFINLNSINEDNLYGFYVF